MSETNSNPVSVRYMIDDVEAALAFYTKHFDFRVEINAFPAFASVVRGLLDLQPIDTGMHLMGWLPEAIDDKAAFRAAAASGVEVTPLSAYSIEPPKRGALRLGYTGYKPREIWRATRRLAAALRDGI